MEALDDAGVPYVITGMDNLFQTAEAEAARQLFYFLAQEADESIVRTAWQSADLGPSERDVYARRFSALGVPLGPDFRGRVRYTRGFNWTAGLGDGDRVELVIEQVAELPVTR